MGIARNVDRVVLFDLKDFSIDIDRTFTRKTDQANFTCIRLEFFSWKLAIENYAPIFEMLHRAVLGRYGYLAPFMLVCCAKDISVYFFLRLHCHLFHSPAPAIR